MSALLTSNGIPPQIGYSLNEAQQGAVISYASSDKVKDYPDWRDGAAAEALQPFTNIALDAADKFTKWGATIGGYSKTGLHSSFLASGETNFQRDLNLHSDREKAIIALKKENIIVLRLLCVSSTTARFIDLTAEENMEAILDQHLLNGRRVYKTELLDWAQDTGRVIKPDPWDVIVFDATTPHLPEGVLTAQRRILQHAWIEMQLPFNWQARVKSGDVPRL